MDPDPGKVSGRPPKCTVFNVFGVSQVQGIGQSHKIAAGSAKITKLVEDRDALNHNAYISD